jgi:hypothetical protein
VTTVLTFAIKHIGGFFVIALIVLLLFSVCYACVLPAGMSWSGVFSGLALGASFLMTLESPRSVTLPLWITAMAWVVCFTGWLMIPLLASALITESLKAVDRENWYIAKFTLLARRVGIPEDKVNEFIKEAMKLKDKTLDE